MYANHFGFRDIPFRDLSDPRHVYMSDEFEAARSELLETLYGGARFVLLPGNAGTGKTKLLTHLQSYLEKSRPIFYLPFSPLQVETFMVQTAARLDFEINEVTPSFEEFQDGLRQCADGPMTPIVLIDDAHSLGCDVLENLVDLFQAEAGEGGLAQVVLAAHPEIEYTLQRSEMAELEENLARLSRLRPLESEDVGNYINFALRTVGYDGEPVFTQEAVRRIAAQTRGVPQLINTLCEASFLVAFGKDLNPVTPDIVDAAVEEVAGFAMSETSEIELDTDDTDDIGGHDLEWIIDPQPVAPRVRERERHMPALVEAWLKRSRRWPIAAVGVGGTVAITAAIVLLTTVPFEDHAANARIRDENTALMERMDQLRGDVRSAHVQRDELESELSVQVDERDRLADRLASLQAEQMMVESKQAPVEAPVEPAAEAELIVPMDDDQTTAEKLLAELMSSAPTEAEQVTGAPTDETMTEMPETYTVGKGDTLWRISQRFGVPVEVLMSLNDLAGGGNIRSGQKLKLTAGPKPLPPLDETSELVVAEIQASPTLADFYTVQAGDSLYGIGRRFESSVDELKRWNQLSDADQLLIGQRLRVAAVQ